MSSTLVSDLLAVLDTLSGGVYAGFRPAHAKGWMYAGTFVPTTDAAMLTMAPHASRPSTNVTVRFSLSAGIPTVADNAVQGSSPQGMAVRFHLGEHAHTDIVAHSYNGFAVRTGEEFLEFLRAIAASGPDAPNPPPIGAFLASHAAANAFVEAHKPIPASFAKQAYFAVTAFKFKNSEGQVRFGRFRLLPTEGTVFLAPEEASAKSTDFLGAEMSARLARAPAEFRIVVQLAEPGDDAADSTVVWPENRPSVDFGRLTITERVDELAPEQRKIIYDPIPRVEGIDSAGDPLSELRSEIYLLSGRRRKTAAAK